MTERIEFVLPYPPTVNTYWRRRGSTYFGQKPVSVIAVMWHLLFASSG
ncbi:putative crossover junction endodeoxyribonuclease [Escherichia coli O55:H7 str. USDA 5905]|nr:putative crossover junction endodeoxyribonuclease [Escherichia coli O55:H7 str. USDA 5905]